MCSKLYLLESKRLLQHMEDLFQSATLNIAFTSVRVKVFLLSLFSAYI